MADNHIDIGEPELTAEDAVKQRLLGRIAVAGVIIVGLLGSLAMFDALYAPRPQPPAPVATVAPPPAETPPAEAPTATTPPVAEAPPAPAVPEKTAAAPADPLPPLPAERLTKPATAQKALAHPAPAVTVPEAVKPPVAKAPAPASRPLSQAPAQQQPPIKQGGPLTALMPPDQPPRQFALQLGIFSNFTNAEELRGKLEAAGIPTTVEARVRAGPFATRGEADAARVKLRQLGIEESIRVSVKR